MFPTHTLARKSVACFSDGRDFSVDFLNFIPSVFFSVLTWRSRRGVLFCDFMAGVPLT